MLDDIVVQIYAASAIPSLWGGLGVLDVLARVLARLSGCSDGVLLVVDHGGLAGWTANDLARSKIEVYSRDNWIARNPSIIQSAKSVSPSLGT